jgi:hypothetical protein
MVFILPTSPSNEVPQAQESASTKRLRRRSSRFARVVLGFLFLMLTSCGIYVAERALYSPEPVATLLALADRHADELLKEAGDLHLRGKAGDWELVSEPAFEQHQAIFKEEINYASRQNLPVLFNPINRSKSIIQEGFLEASSRLDEARKGTHVDGVAKIHECGKALHELATNDKLIRYVNNAYVKNRRSFSVFDPFQRGRLELLDAAERAVVRFETHVESFNSKVDRVVSLPTMLSKILEDGDSSELEGVKGLTPEEMTIIDFLISEATDTCRRSRPAYVFVSALSATREYLDANSQNRLDDLKKRFLKTQRVGGKLLSQLSSSKAISLAYPENKELLQSLGKYSIGMQRRIDQVEGASQ